MRLPCLSRYRGLPPQAHIALPGTEPNFTDKNILYLYRSGLQCAPFATGLHGRKIHSPTAIGSRHGLLALSGKLHNYFFMRIGTAPYRNIAIPLQNHMVRKRRRQLNRRQKSAKYIHLVTPCLKTPFSHYRQYAAEASSIPRRSFLRLAGIETSHGAIRNPLRRSGSIFSLQNLTRPPIFSSQSQFEPHGS